MEIFFIIILIFILFGLIVAKIRQSHDLFTSTYLWSLFAIHQILSITYLIYALNSPSDSRKYFRVSSKAEEWMPLFGVGTEFISFLAWPFTHFFGFSYFTVMIIFSFLGFIGILLLYRTAKENEKSLFPEKRFFGFTEILFLLPNVHFWTSSIGKGSIIILGIGLFFFGLSRFNRRIPYILLGMLLIYLVRPHILFAVLIATFLGVLITNSGIKKFYKFFIIIVSTIFIYLISDNVIEFTEVTNFDVLNSSELDSKAKSLSRATSGIDISSYSIPMKLFSFWFRPLFIDAPNIVGLIVSFENLYYIYIFTFVLIYGFRYWAHLNGWYRICIFMFILASIVLSQVTGNLGIALRQKAQIMPLLFIFASKLILLRRDFRNLDQVSKFAKK
jgi:hypothetical protein